MLLGEKRQGVLRDRERIRTPTYKSTEVSRLSPVQRNSVQKLELFQVAIIKAAVLTWFPLSGNYDSAWPLFSQA